MSIYELKILFDLNPESKLKVLDKHAKRFRLGYFFVDSNDGHFYLFDEHGNEKNVSVIHEINYDMIPKDIQKIVIPDYVANIWDMAFFSCSGLTNVTIPDSVTSIGDLVFRNCSSLTNVIIPDSVTSIGSWAFEDCINLMSVTIGNGVMNIGYRVFHDCNNLKSLIFKGKTIDQVKLMENYPFGIIEDESVIKAELS